MIPVKVKLLNKTFQLNCPAEAQDELLNLVEQLDIKLQVLQESNPNASFELLLVILSLNLINEQNNHNTATAGEILTKNQQEFNQQLELIANALDQLSSKIKQIEQICKDQEVLISS